MSLKTIPGNCLKGFRKVKMSLPIDLTVTHRSGGLLVFMEQGIYVNELVFHSPSLKRTWRLKWDDKKDKGSLKLKGEVIFNFVFDEKGCRVQSVKNGKTSSDWKYIDTVIEMCD